LLYPSILLSAAQLKPCGNRRKRAHHPRIDGKPVFDLMGFPNKTGDTWAVNAEEAAVECVRSR
jgi:hypothetical protein